MHYGGNKLLPFLQETTLSPWSRASGMAQEENGALRLENREGEARKQKSMESEKKR